MWLACKQVVYVTSEDIVNTCLFFFFILLEC